MMMSGNEAWNINVFDKSIFARPAAESIGLRAVCSASVSYFMFILKYSC